MTNTLKMAGQIGLLWGIYEASNWFVTFTGVPVPANVLGIVLLFTLLSLGIVKESFISGAADFLLRHLVFFFVPIAVGLMNWGEVFYNYGVVLLAAIVVSALLPLFGVGFLAQILQKEKK